MKQKTWWISTALIFISALFLLVFSLVSLAEIEEVYVENTRTSIEGLKRQFLYDSVNNQIQRIKTQRQIIQKQYQDRLDSVVCHMDQAYELSDGFVEKVNFYFSKQTKTPWVVLLWNKESGDVLFDANSGKLAGETPFDVLDRILFQYQIHYLHTYEPYNLFIGLSQDQIDEEVKNTIAEEIYNSNYSENSYIWVNEVVNYDGGDDYAIRRIHPNLRDTVGTHLSTSLKDIQGNTPYKTELEGIVKDGEVFFTYYFQKKDSEVVSEKLTYAKLYKDFDWVVAMGIHLDDMGLYVDVTNEESSRIVRTIALVFIIAIVLLFIGSITFSVGLDRAVKV